MSRGGILRPLKNDEVGGGYGGPSGTDGSDPGTVSTNPDGSTTLTPDPPEKLNIFHVIVGYFVLKEVVGFDVLKEIGIL